MKKKIDDTPVEGAEKIELFEWQQDLMDTVLNDGPGYTVVNVPRRAGKSTIAAILAQHGAYVFTPYETSKNVLLRYGAPEALVDVFDTLKVRGFDFSDIRTFVFDDVEPPQELLNVINVMEDKQIIYLRSPPMGVIEDGELIPVHALPYPLMAMKDEAACECGQNSCEPLRKTKVMQFTEMDYAWDAEAKTLIFNPNLPLHSHAFTWMPEWKLPDWATGRVFYFSTMGSDEALNKARFDVANKNRIAGSLVGASLNQNHKRYDMTGQNIIIDTEVDGERLEGLCYVEDPVLLAAYDAGDVVGCSIDYKDRNYDKAADYDVEGAFGEGLAWVTKPFICGFPDSKVWEATATPDTFASATKVMVESLADFVDRELLKQRTVVFQGYVSGHTCAELAKSLEYLGSISDEPIKVILNSGGGSVFAGLLAFDTIKKLTTSGIEVTTEARGLAASMGAIIIQAGTRRLATPNTRFLIHEVSSWAWGKTSEMEEEIKEIKKVNDMLKTIIAERTGKTVDEIEAIWHKRDVWLSATEALEFGLIDEIIEGEPKTLSFAETSYFEWMNAIELRFDGLLAKEMSATELFKRLEKEEEDDDDDDEEDEKNLVVDPDVGGGGVDDGGVDVAVEDLVIGSAVPSGITAPLDDHFAFIESGGTTEDGITVPHNLRHLQFRTDDGYDELLLLDAMENLQQMIFNGEISKSASEAAKFQLMAGFNALSLKIPEWAIRPDLDIQTDRMSPKTRAQLRRSWADRADAPRRFHRDRVRRQMGFDPGSVADVSDTAGKLKRSE